MRVRRSRAAGRAMAAMVEEDSWDTGREKKRTRMKKSKEPKGGGMEWACPACAQGVRYPERLARHMVRCCPELCAASTDGPLGQARAVAGRIPKELRTRAAPEDPGEAERHGLCWRDLRARPNKAGPMTPDEERRAREVRGRSIRNKRPLARLEPRIFVF